MKLVIVSAAALIDFDGRILLSKRPPNKSMPGCWEFPGGKLKKSETPEEALIRELKEEIGIDTVKSCLSPLAFASHNYEDFHLLMPLFACRKWDGVPLALENQELGWFCPAEMRKLDMPPADIPLISVLRDWL